MMDDDVRAAWGQMPEPRRPRRWLRGWLLAGGFSLAFLAAMGVGAVFGSGLLGTAQAAGGNSPSVVAPLRATFIRHRQAGHRGSTRD